MVEGDDREAALEAATRFPTDRAAHFWDEPRVIGRVSTGHLVSGRLADLRQATSGIPDLAGMVVSWEADPSSTPPAWDCAFFYPPGDRWTEPMPEPHAWTKQFGYWENTDATENGGTFWCNRSPTALVNSSWAEEMDLGMNEIGVDASETRIGAVGFDR